MGTKGTYHISYKPYIVIAYDSFSLDHFSPKDDMIEFDSSMSRLIKILCNESRTMSHYYETLGD